MDYSDCKVIVNDAYKAISHPDDHRFAASVMGSGGEFRVCTAYLGDKALHTWPEQAIVDVVTERLFHDYVETYGEPNEDSNTSTENR